MADLVTQAALLADVDAKVTTNGANENTGARVNSNLHNIVDTLWNHAGITGVDVGNCLFVNSTTGDDPTGVRGRMDKMYKTLDGAYAASVAGDVIVIFDAGTYTFNNDVTKDLNIYAPLATIDPQGGSESSLLLAVNDLNVTIECNVFDGPIAQDSGVTGGVLTLTVKDCTDNIEAETVLIYGGNIQGSVTSGSDGYCAIQGATVNLDITGIDIGLYNSVCESALKPLNGGSAGLSNSRANKVEPVSGTASIVSIGSHVNIPPGPSITSSSIESSVGFSPLLTASFNYMGPTGDPGTARWGVDDGTFADITKVRLSTTDYNGNDIADYLDAQTSGQLELRTLDYSKRILFTVTGVSGTGVYRTFDVTPVLGSFPINEEFYTFDFREAGGGSSTLTDSIGGLIEVAADTTYRLGGPSAFAYTIESLDVETDSGTITVAVKINGTAVTGLSAVSASSTPASAAATAANVVAVGDYLTFEGSSNSAATGLLFGITITRTP